MRANALGVEMNVETKGHVWARSLPWALLLAAGAVLPASRASAQSYTLTTSSGTLSSIRSTGTALSFASADDGSAPITPGFSVPFFGSYGSTLYASTNGLLSVDVDSVDYSNTTIPSSATPNGFIAPMWDDLAIPTGTSAGIYYLVSGSGSSHVLTVEWADVAPLSNATDTMSFQVKIYEATGNIEIYYGARAGTASTWSATIGLEDPTGSTGYMASCLTAAACTPSDVPSGTKLVFTASSLPPPSSVDLQVSYVDPPPSSVTGGTSLSLYYEVANNGTSSASGAQLAVYAGASPTVTTSDLLIGSVTLSSIAAGSYTSGYLSGTVPSGLPSGTYYVAAIVDPFQSVTETNESNNSYSLGSVSLSGGGGGGTITVLSESLPDGTAGQPYTAQLQASGAPSPSWSIVSGALPEGLSLSTGGLISGTPRSEMTTFFVVQAAASGYTAGVAELSIVVRSGGGGATPSITTTSIPAAVVGVPYTASVMATGGTPPYAFQIVSERPSWLRLSSGGAFSGTPDATGSYDLLVSVFDSASHDATAVLHLEITQPSALALVESLPSAVVGQAYTAPVVVGGRPPYTITLTMGTLPGGLSFDSSTGAITGTPSMAGSWTLGLSVTDGAGATARGNLTLSAVQHSELHIVAGDIVVYTNTAAMAPLSAQGGVAPYTWSIVSGALQEGLSLDGEAGRIVGRVSRVSTATVTFAVSDSMGNHAEAELHVKAQVYRAGGSRSGGSSRESGCTCVVPATKSMPGPTFLLVAGLVFLGLGRGRRARARLRREGYRGPRHIV